MTGKLDKKLDLKKMKLKLILEGNRLQLRRLRLSDAQEIYKRVKERAISRWTLNIPYPYPKDGARRFILKSQREWRKKKSYVFGIILKESGKVIGIVSLLKVNRKNNKNAEIGYWLGKKYWGKGLMTEAVKLILKFGFKELGLHLIYGIHLKENIGSGKVLEKSGFKKEGVRKECFFRYKRWHDVVWYGLLKKEWIKK